MKAIIEDSSYEIVRLFPRPGKVGLVGARAIVEFDGALVMANHEEADTWKLGEPARPGEELETLNQLMKSRLGTTVTVTSPDGDTETFEDP